MCYRLLFYVFFFLSLANLLYAQTFRFEHLGNENGLENLDIQAIIQDKQGFIWIATLGGLHRFDGYNSKVFSYEAEKKKGISSNLVYTLYEDKNGFIWIGTRYGLNRFNPKTETFTTHTHFEGEYVLENRAIRNIYADKQGFLWLSVSGLGLLRFDTDTQRFDKIFTHEKEKNLHLLYPKFFYQDKQGNQWIGGDEGLSLLFAESNKIVNLPQKTLPNKYVKCVLEDLEGNLWFGTDGGIAFMSAIVLRKFKESDIQTLEFEWIKQKEEIGNSLDNDFVKCFAQDSKGNIWVGTDNGLAYLSNQKLKAGRYEFTSIVHDENDDSSLLNNYCRVIAIDRQDIVWIGTGNGVSRYAKDRFPFRTFKHEKNNNNSLNDNYVRAILCQKMANEDKNKPKKLKKPPKSNDTVKFTGKQIQKDSIEIIWIGTNSGVAKFDKTNKIFEFFDTKKGLPVNNVKALVADKEGNIWIGTDKGLAVLNPKTSLIKTYIHDKANENSIPDNAINCLFVDKEGIIWIGTWKGLAKYDIENQQFTQVYTQFKDRVQSIFKDEDGELWVGTRDGLIRIESEIAATTYLHDIQNEKSIASSYINCISQVEKDKILIGTSNGGLSRFNKKTGLFEHFTVNHGLQSNNVNFIIQGNEGKLWIGTDKGLSRIDFDNKRIRTYMPQDGLASAAFSHLAVSCFKSGEIFVGTMSGFSSFFPKRIKDNPHNPPVYITDFKLFQKTVGIDEQKSLTQSIMFDQYIVLKHSDKMVTFDFIALDYRNPLQLKYAYKLENFDDDWHYSDAHDRYATYTNLPAGTYKFMVKATNNDGYWSRNEASVYIDVKPPYWKTWWFVVSCVLGAGLLLYAFMYWRERDLIATQNQLEQEVIKRTAELTAQKNKLEDAQVEISINLEEIETQRDEIEAQRDNISRMNLALEKQVLDRTQKLVEKNKELDQFLYRAAHDLKGPLARMKGLVNLGLIEIEDEIAIDYFEKLDFISIEMLKLLNRIRQIHDIKNKEIAKENIDFEAIVENTLYQIIRKQNIATVKIQTDIVQNLAFQSDKELINLLLYNLIENAACYTTYEQKSKIRIEVKPFCKTEDENEQEKNTEQNQNGVEILVIDNGIGIDKLVHDRVFSMFFVGTSQSKGMGLGLYEVKLIADKLDGQVGFVCENGQTTFWVRL
jgi:ligand-binding sensor domain-containing protein/signal transduction histidine kinase